MTNNIDKAIELLNEAESLLNNIPVQPYARIVNIKNISSWGEYIAPNLKLSTNVEDVHLYGDDGQGYETWNIIVNGKEYTFSTNGSKIIGKVEDLVGKEMIAYCTKKAIFVKILMTDTNPVVDFTNFL